ncbi:alpha/beta fold hydrolase [Nocardia asiatica]|uniref:alpha/beta fold hydrolase n=1 Tax=Nocardia asiatica TaxID=209252 RepID=UPI0002EB5E12|nr:alpha/beta fold hydrolase [Nocardia asiatica]
MSPLVSDDPTAIGAGFTEKSVQIDGFTIRYFEAGTGEPLVVIHAAGGPRMTPALDALTAHNRVLALEVPGFGSEANTVHENMTELVDTLAGAIAAIGVDRYHLLGSSFGGAVAAWLAVTHPDRIISMVLEGPAEIRENSTPPVGLELEELVRRFRVHPERTPAFAPPDPGVSERSWPLVERVVGSRPEVDEDFTRRLSDFHVRTLVLFGDRDGIVPPENGRTWRRLMPNCAFVLVHDAAHDIQGDRGEAFADVVGDWLARGWQFLLPDQSTLINP